MPITVTGAADQPGGPADAVPTLYEISVQGRGGGLALPALDVPEAPLPEGLARADNGLPELSQLDVVRHYLRLSQRNFGVDTGFYPLGSCTMKYNPKINEEIARLPGFSEAHPLSPAAARAGQPRADDRTAEWLAEIGGFAGVSLQPAAGAHGEFTALLMIRAYHAERGEHQRNRILIPEFGARHQPGLDDHGGLHRRRGSLRRARQHRSRGGAHPPATIKSPAS